MKLGDIIREYRTAHGYSQRQFANICDLSNGYISILEKGFNPKTGEPVVPTLPRLQKLAVGMRTTINDLLEQADDISIDIGQNDYRPVHIENTSTFTNDETKLIADFRKLGRRSQIVVLNLIASELQMQDEYNEMFEQEAWDFAKEHADEIICEYADMVEHYSNCRE